MLTDEQRRAWLRDTGSSLALLQYRYRRLCSRQGKSKRNEEQDEEVSPAEDLMREHGVP
jgi:hypothetical protein